MKKIFLLLLLSIACVVSYAQLKGKVVAVADGDTFTLLTADNKQIKIRLHGIDCPEKKQAYGNVAKQFTADKVFSKYVEVKDGGNDRYGRTIGIVYLQDGTILNELLLSNGLAWHYLQYDKNKKWDELERQARVTKKGLWKDEHAIAPWEFRKQKRAVNHK